MLFKDRKEAGRLLGEYLKEKGVKADLVLGIPRGGLVVAKEVADILGTPLSLLVVRKLGVPSNPELAFGAIDPEGHIYTDAYTVRYFGLSEEHIATVAKAELRRIKEMEEKFLKGKEVKVEGKRVLVVDDGVATGYTVMAGIRYLRRKGASRVIVAVPVCPADTAKRLEEEADEFYCLHVSEEPGFAVGAFYKDFSQVEDHQVEELLQE